MEFSLILYFAFCCTAVLPHNLNVLDLNIIKTIQDMYCIPENTCSKEMNISGNSLPDNNKTTSFPASIHLPVIPPVRPSPTCCGQCSCDIENCDVSDSCCIEAWESIWSYKELKIRMTCEYPQLRRYDIELSNTGVPILMFRECPKTSKNMEIVKKCDQSDNYLDIETKIPVTDNATMYIYKNRFCAFCHNVTESSLHYWNAHLECLRERLIPRNITSIVTEVLRTKSCNLLYSRPASLGKKAPFYQCREVISKCNVTGHWETYNPFIEAACLAYSTIYNFKYRNVFCYLCNTKDLFSFDYCTDISRPIIFVDFKALIRFQPENDLSSISSKQDTYSRNKIYDPLKKQYRDVECLFPKTVENGDCIYLVENIGGIMYGIYLKLTPLHDLEVGHLLKFHFVATQIKKEIYAFLPELIWNERMFSFSLYSKLYKPNGETADATKNKILYLVVYLQVDCSTRSPVKSDIVDKLMSFHDTVLSARSHIHNNSVNNYYVEVDIYQAGPIIPDQFYKSINDLIPVLSEIKSSRNPLTVLSRPYICPSVRLYDGEYNIVRSTDSVFIEEYNATVDSRDVLIENLSDGKNFSVRICTSVFKRLLQQLSIIAEPAKTNCGTETFSFKTILTFVCTTLSICFSLLTIVVYVKFNKLDTQPGVNNVVLCLSLITAQSLYQFGSGQSCNISKFSCQVIGIVVHFTWLFLMFWMNSCCIHMFRVFKLHQTKMPVFNIVKTTLVYVLYSFLSSIILILTNVTVNLVTSDGSDIGYGGSLCYISQGHIVAYLFALPVAIIVVLNIILFTIVVFQMRNTSEVKNETNRQQFLHIYAKLSTLTGGTWVFGFTSYFLNIDVLDYIFIILNASQGVFLFFAFVANRRTWKLIARRKNKELTVNRNHFSNIGGSTNLSTLSK